MILPLLLFLLAPSALAEVYEGRTAALETVQVRAAVGGGVEAVEVEAGQRVAPGEALIRLSAERTFAGQDGTVSLVYAEAGDAVSGPVLEIAPLERYAIHCTVDKAYQSADSTLVHGGETVYVKCTADGTHRAVGVVTQVEGGEYRVITLGGELYVGETVYLYRDADFTADQRVGIGTVVVSDVVSYEAEGELTRLNVSEGDYVERGQLLYEIGGGEVSAPVAGIVASVSCEIGDAVAAEQAVVGIVPEGAVCVEIELDEAAAARVSVGDTARLTFAGEEDEDASPGTVIEISAMAEDGCYTVRIRPESERLLPLGMSVRVRL